VSTRTVSIHPYFKVHAGKLEEARALLPKFVERTSSEAGVIYYEFTVREDVVFCREAYVDAAAALAHLQNVDAILKAMLAISDLQRLEFHGPAAELDQLREPLKALEIQWFTLEASLERPRS